MSPPDRPISPEQNAARARRSLLALWALVALTCLPEAVLILADQGLIGSTRWRSLAYQNGAFWAGLLRNWSPNYTAQPITMYLSYAWLHAGFGHLTGNIAGLIWLGGTLAPVLGAWRFMTLYIGAAIAGAAVFGLISPSPAPMVGASGAVFGLAGAWMVQQWRQDRRPIAEGGRSTRAAWLWLGQIALVLLAVNIVSWLLQDGQLAWETHLGGFVAGVILALLLGQPRSGPKPPPL